MAYISFQPSDYFNTKLYTGTGSSNAITGVGFQPDWLWIKDRDSGSNSNVITDAIRGTNKIIFSDSSGAELTDATRVTSFDSDGFTVGTSGSTNTNTNDYVAWNWKANGSGSANTDGSISSTVSANTTAGFSIASFTSPASGNFTFGHGLGVAPNVVILKTTGATSSWSFFHSTVCDTVRKYLTLETTNALTTNGSDLWGASLPTSSVMGATSGQACVGSQSCIAYCFAEKKGFSKFGSYTGNGSTDGTFIYTGFRPAFFMWKASSTTGGWYTIDNKRSDYNPSDKLLGANDSSAESAFGYNYDHDFLSNGIKTRYGSFDMNQSGVTYIYMAFAEHPLVSSNDIPAVAR